jgi:glucan phosphoethanolaminetransferase (alkaline phosphatase superfamily)
VITLFNRAIYYILLVGVLSASLALMNLVLQFSWLALLIFILTMLMVFLIFQQESKIQNYDGVSIENKPIEDTDELESKVQERTLELNIALQELEDANKELQEKKHVR